MAAEGRRPDQSRGQGLTEFALVLPVMIVLMLAIFDAGRAVVIYNGLTNAAREGARMAIVNQDVTLIERRVQDMAFVTSVSNLGSVVSFVRESDPSETCDPLSIGCIAVVEPQATWQAITPVVGDIIGALTLSARAEMPIEFVCPNARIPQYTTSAACPKQP